jgi:hypothetical protein
MPNSLKSRSLQALKVTVAFSPWVASMYLFYWLDSSGTWTSETPHRGKISVLILSIGMLLSLLVHTLLAGRRQR